MSQPYGHRAEIERLDERSDSTSGSAAHGVGARDYWSLDTDGWRIIAMNAQLAGTATEEEVEQWSWLARCGFAG